MNGGWHRLHPLSPVVRGGKATIGLAVVLLPDLLGGRSPIGLLIQVGVAAGLTGLGFVSWVVTRWRVDGDDLQIETGLLRRQSLRFPLRRVQAIDIVRPGLGRIFGLAELRLRMGGASGDTARLAYLPLREAEPLRARLLGLAGGASAAGGTVEEGAVEERVVTTVPTPRLIGSILISDVGLVGEVVLTALIVTAVLSPSAAAAVATGGGFWLLAVVGLVWRRFNDEYRLTVAEAPDGLRVRSGLVALTAETIRPGRVQAVRLVEPLLWRPLGWCRLEVDLAGRQRSKGEGQAERRRLRALLPVGDRALADELLGWILPGAPKEQSRPPGRVRWKSPLRYRMLAWAWTSTCVGTTSGRLRRVTCFVPLEKIQSVRRVQGPLQRRLGLASVHIDTAGRNVRAAGRDRDVEEANGALAELPALARAARNGAQTAVATDEASRPGS